MEDLIGKMCSVVFDMPTRDWPYPGYPAHVIVLGVSNGMLRLRGEFDSKEVWVNLLKIQTIAAKEQVITTSDNTLVSPP